MDIPTLIKSGIIEAYCLGEAKFAQMRKLALIAQRHPEVQAEIVRTHAMLRQLNDDAPMLHAHQEKVLHILRQLRLEQDMTLYCLPLLTPYSDHRLWLQALDTLQPTNRLSSFDFYVLQETPNLLQTLIWMKTAIEEDGHPPEDFQESFLVLEGECECNVGGEIIHLTAGGYLAIPANTLHVIQNLHPDRPVLGVMQRYRAAA